MRKIAIIFILLTLGIAHGSILLAQVDVEVGFDQNKLLVSPGESFKLNLTIIMGGALVRAGEFDLSYNESQVELTEVIAGDGWSIQLIQPSKYLFYTLSEQPNKTTVAVLYFKHKKGEAFDITISSFKAADSAGEDLNVILKTKTAHITVSTPTTEGTGIGGGGGGREAERGFAGWLLVSSLATTVLMLLTALYLKTSKVPTYYLMINGRPFVESSDPDRIYGREDFIKILPPEKLRYITRRAKGGQFRITMRNGDYYIIDNHSKNPTHVDGVKIRGRGYIKLRNGSVIGVPNVFKLIFRVKTG